jgi:hypothetical protein
VVSFDFDAAVRWARFDPQQTLARRPDPELPFVAGHRNGGQALLLDTCVYIDQLQDGSPDLLEVLIAARQANHSTVAIQELMHTVGVLDPKDRRSPAAVATIRGLVLSMPPHRFSRLMSMSFVGLHCSPEFSAACRATRPIGNYALYSTAFFFCRGAKLAFTVLTANIGDFDLLLQLQPAGRVLFYRRK